MVPDNDFRGDCVHDQSILDRIWLGLDARILIFPPNLLFLHVVFD